MQSHLEGQKKDILKEIEKVKGDIARQNDFLKVALDVKNQAYRALFIASERCYRELQNLAKGEFKKNTLKECERALGEARALAANLPDEDQAIANQITQIVFNVVDTAEDVQGQGEVKRKAYEDIWNEHARLGKAMDRLRARAPFKNKSVDF